MRSLLGERGDESAHVTDHRLELPGFHSRALARVDRETVSQFEPALELRLHQSNVRKWFVQPPKCTAARQLTLDGLQ